MNDETYRQAWESLFDSLLEETQNRILARPYGFEAGELAREARDRVKAMANAKAVRMAYPKGRWS